MNKGKLIVVAAATDGACSGNPGPGGWGALIRFEDGSVQEFGGHHPATTNNRMELQAALKIFEELKRHAIHPQLKLRTDSKYLINGLSKWIQTWKKKGWKTSAGKPVLNQDLWDALDKTYSGNIQLEYVKGHSGDVDNDRVDKIAVSFSKGIQPKLISNKQKNTSGKETCEKLNQIASEKVKKLISKFEIADYCAKNGYLLKPHEISEIVEIPLKELEKTNKSIQWRNWILKVNKKEGMWTINGIK